MIFVPIFNIFSVDRYASWISKLGVLAKVPQPNFALV